MVLEAGRAIGGFSLRRLDRRGRRADVGGRHDARPRSCRCAARCDLFEAIPTAPRRSASTATTTPSSPDADRFVPDRSLRGVRACASSRAPVTPRRRWRAACWPRPSAVAALGAVAASPRRARVGRSGARPAPAATSSSPGSASRSARRTPTTGRPQGVRLRRAPGRARRGERELRTAEQVAERLGNMKGALMKLGQMASYLDDGLPEPLRQALAQLQANAPPMRAELAAEVIERELGRPPDELFVEWDPEPIAAASHRPGAPGRRRRPGHRRGAGRRREGAVPGRREAIEADLRNADLLGAILRAGVRRARPDEMVAEIKERHHRGARLRARGHATRPLRRLLPRPPVHPRARRAARAVAPARVLTTRARRRRARGRSC